MPSLLTGIVGSRYTEKTIDIQETLTCTNLESKIKDIKAKFRKAHRKTADGYEDLPLTIVHELTHTHVGGKATVSNAILQ